MTEKEETYIKVGMSDMYNMVLSIKDTLNDMKSKLESMDRGIHGLNAKVDDHEERLRGLESQKSTIVSFLALSLSIIGPLALVLLKGV